MIGFIIVGALLVSLGASAARSRDLVPLLRAIPTAPEWCFGLDIAARADWSRPTLYVDLARLERDGLIRSECAPRDPADPDWLVPRRRYQLTNAGRDVAWPSSFPGGIYR